MGKVTEGYEKNTPEDEFVQVQCAECKRETRHQVMQSLDFSRSESFVNDQYSVDWTSNHQITQCQGCMSITFRQRFWCSEDVQQIGEDEYDEGAIELLYPKRSEHSLPTKEFLNVPSNLKRIYRETIECFNNDAFTLSAAGLRALVEGLCAELGVNDGPKEITKGDGTTETIRKNNLEGKIAGLSEMGFLTQHNSGILHEHRFLGNEAVHELAQPSRDELKLAIEIIEHTFDTVYEIPQKGQDLQSKRTQRKNNP